MPEIEALGRTLMERKQLDADESPPVPMIRDSTAPLIWSAALLKTSASWAKSFFSLGS